MLAYMTRLGAVAIVFAQHMHPYITRTWRALLAAIVAFPLIVAADDNMGASEESRPTNTPNATTIKKLVTVPDATPQAEADTEPTAAAASAAVIEPFTATYTVGNNVLTAGTATLSLQNEGFDWTYSIKTKPTGIFKFAGKGKIEEISVIDIRNEDDKLVVYPLSYSFRQDNEKKRAVDAWFDWGKSEVTHQYRGTETVQEFSEPLVDRLSATLVVMDRLSEGFDEMKLPVFDTGRVKTVVFVNEGTTTLSTKLGKLQTIKIRNHNEGNDRRHTRTWFAPELDYAPVRIEQYKRNDLVVRFTLRALDNSATNKKQETRNKKQETRNSLSLDPAGVKTVFRISRASDSQVHQLNVHRVGFQPALALLLKM